MSEDEKVKVMRPRKSACMDAAFRSQMKRIEAMTIEERVKAALSMPERFAWLKEVSREKR